jgi:phenylalanyl-tRNA synthetase alpha subunit
MEGEHKMCVTIKQVESVVDSKIGQLEKNILQKIDEIRKDVDAKITVSTQNVQHEAEILELGTNNRFSELNNKLDVITKNTEATVDHLKKLNGTVAKHSEKLTAIEKDTDMHTKMDEVRYNARAITCPTKTVLDDRIRKLEDIYNKIESMTKGIRWTVAGFASLVLFGIAVAAFIIVHLT